jgi:hypothetical protein
MNDIDFSFNDDKFYIDYTSCGFNIGNLREESEKFAANIFEQDKNVIVSLSSGLDSQIVLHSFYSQGISVKCAFMHLPNFNDIEYERVLVLQQKYNFDLIIKELNPDSLKDDLFSEYEKTKIPPYHLLHKKFLSLLPSEFTFIQGLDGPDFLYYKEKFCILQTANSLVNTRTRAFRLLNRSGALVNWERKSNILLSILQDELFDSFLYAYNNMSNNNLAYTNGKDIKSIDGYELYVKPLLYGKYWKDELEYFPKYQGCEKISWVMDSIWHNYRNNVTLIPLGELKEHLALSPGTVKRYYQLRGSQS